LQFSFADYGRVPYGYTSLPVLRKRSDVETYQMAVLNAMCGWAAMFCWSGKVVIDKSLEGFGRLISAVLLLDPKEIQERSMGPAKDTSMPKSALVMSEYQNNLMRNQCIEQCAIYIFLIVGPTWDGPLGPISPFWLFLDPMLKGEITRESSKGWRCSVVGHEGLCGWMFSSCSS